MKKIVQFGVVFFAFNLFSFSVAQNAEKKISSAPSAEDFLNEINYKPVSEGGSGDVKEPEKIKKEDGVLKAASVQDAVNAAAEEHQKIAAKKDDVSEGLSTIVAFPSGIGFVASGVSNYEVFGKNPTATAISRRNAYVRAHTKAKIQLYKMINGFDSKAKTIVKESVQNEIEANGNKSSIKENLSELIEQRAEGMLGGYLTHEVKDDADNTTVTVSLFTIPKDFKVKRITTNMVEATTLKAGVDRILTEVKNGLVPPVGGRIVNIVGSNEKAFVGFGSAVIVDSSVPRIKAQNRSNAQRSALMAADDAVGTILFNPDRLSWVSRSADTTKREMNDFGDSEKDDPLAVPGKNNSKKVDGYIDAFKSIKKSSETFSSIRENKLPPGLQNRVWDSDDKGFVFAISIWIPSVSAAAKDIGAARSKSILEEEDSKSNKEKDSKKDLEKVKPLPSGKIKNDL